MSEIGTIEFVFLLLLFFIVGLGLLARRLNTPYPIVMVVGGLILSLVPAVPNVSLDPQLVFLVILPPLLYASAWTTSWRDFRYNIVSILLLAIGLVVFTALGVAFAAPRVLSNFDWRLGLALGAVVAPTDAIAATSIARRVGLPNRIVDILEGESLINDATGLLALQFATSIVVYRQLPTLTTGLFTFTWLVFGGVGFGFVVGWIVDRVERYFDDAPIEITLSILVPYAVYLAADAAHASGVLAVVTCGLFLSRRSAHLFSSSVRIEIWSFWQSFTFVLNGLVFVLIGLQLSAIRDSIREYSAWLLLRDGAIFSLLLIALRLVWIYPSAHIAYFLRRRILHQKEKPPETRQIFVIGWTGMRGVVSLAAALALPSVLADGTAFPHRGVIVFLTFCVIVVTLVLQGVTLPPLIRALGLAGGMGRNCEEQDARRIVIESAVAHLEEAKGNDAAEQAEIYDDLIRHYQQRLARLEMEGEGNENHATDHHHYVEISRGALRVEHNTAIRLRDEGRINDEVLRRIERELDLTESRFAMADESPVNIPTKN